MLRPRPLAGPGRNIGSRSICWSSAAGALYLATLRRSPPSRKISDAVSASHRRVAFSTMVLKTGSSSPGELEMTPSTSDVAVCCSNASLSSCVRSSTCFSSRSAACAFSASSSSRSKVFLRQTSTARPIAATSSPPSATMGACKLPPAIASMPLLSAVRRRTMLRPT